MVVCDVTSESKEMIKQLEDANTLYREAILPIYFALFM